MLRKSTMVALAAVAAVGLTIGSADAKPGPSFSPKYPGFSPVKPIGLSPIKPVFPKPLIPIKPIKPVIPIIPIKPPFKPIPIGPLPLPPPGKPDVHVHFPRPILYAAPVITGAAYVASRPVVAGPCTCLSKEYTPEGAVLFKDRCTNEAAMNPPPAPPPQQTGSLEPQAQPAYAQQYVQPTPDPAQPTMTK
jgi:hypothetical protein